MASPEEPPICGICADFEPQAWRKSLCRNCFHSLDEHSEDMLAAEAEVASREKRDGNTNSKAGEPKLKNEAAKKCSNAPVENKDTKTKPKLTPSAPSKPPSVGPPVGVKVKQQSTSSLSSSTSTTTSSSRSPSSSKTSLKPSTSATSKSSPSSSTSASSLSSSSSSTSSSTSGLRTGKPAPSLPSPTPVISKAKSLTSKFESKTLEDKDSKLVSKSPSKLGLKSKPTDSGDTVRTDETENGKSATSSTMSSKVAPLSKTGSGKDLKKPGEEKSKTSVTARLKDTSDSGTPGKVGSDLKIAPGRTKNIAPFGKDMLKNTKEAVKKEKDKCANEPPSNNSNKKENDQGIASKTDLVSKGNSSQETMINDDKNNLVTMKKSLDIIDKSKSNLSSNGSKSGLGISTPNKLTEEKLGHSKAQRSDGTASKLPDDLEHSRSTREIDKTGKITGGQIASEVSTQEREVEKRHISSDPGDAKGNNSSKQLQDKPGRTASEREGKGSTALKDQVDANSKFANSSNHGTGPPAKKGPTGHDAVDRGVAKSKDSGIDVKTSVDNQSSTPTSNVGSSPITSSTSSGLNTTTVTVPVIPSVSRTTSSTVVASTGGVSSISSLSSSLSTSTSSSSKSANSDKKENGENNGEKEQKVPTTTSVQGRADERSAKRLSEELKKKEEQVVALEKQLSKMETKLKTSEHDRNAVAKEATQAQKDEMAKSLQSLREQLAKMENQCAKLEKDNKTLEANLHVQEKTVKRDQDTRGITEDNAILQQDLERTEIELDDVKEENSELKREVMEMKNEMDEMYDTFRDNEHDEFRELQKELDITAKNCRILQFKLRKAERRNEQIEEDRIHYEDKLRSLQDQFDSADAKTHIRILEEELRVAKEMSVRLHDELDIVEDKRNKALEDNKHLTELLEHTDKRQFRMEMEIDKLRDMIAQLRQQLKEEKNRTGGNDGNCINNNNKDSSSERKLPVATLTTQTSRDCQDYDVSQLMKDLCDSMERENDLKDQLKFTEEEAKMMRRRVSENDEENENLRLQLKKMSEKASKHKKQEQKRVKELEEERKASDAVRAALIRLQEESDVVLVIGPEDSDIISGDEPIPISERKDSTDEDLMNVMQMRVQLEMLEQELMTSHKKLDEMDLENENLHDEVKFLQARLEEEERSQDSNLKPPEPSSPNAYYDEKIKELTQDVDDLRWKLIEKDREIERLGIVQTRHNREHSHSKRCERLKKSKSLDNDNEVEMKDLRKQMEQLQMEVIRYKTQVEVTEERNDELSKQITESSNRHALPQVEADDAAIENIELKDQVKRMEADAKEKADTIKLLTENLQRLSRDTRSIATSPLITGSPGILNIPPSWPAENLGARGKTSDANQLDGSLSRDPATQLLTLQEENIELRRQMDVLRLQEPRGVADGSPSRAASVSFSSSSSPSSSSSSRAIAKAAATSAEENPPPARSISDLSSLPSRSENESEENISEEAKGLLPRSTSKLGRGNENKTQSSAGLSSTQVECERVVSRSLHPLLISYSFDSEQLDEEGGEIEIEGEYTTAKGLKARTSASSLEMATVTKDNDFSKANKNTSKLPDDEGGGGGGCAVSARSRSDDEDKGKKSILSDYPDGKSKVVVTGEESRVELMEKILDMDDEIGDLISCVRKREDEHARMYREVKVMKVRMQELKDDTHRNERELLQELDMLHDKNTVMSNLLDIINERAEAAEDELERRIEEGNTTSPPRSASNVSQVSAISDTSMGSDEVFLNAHGTREGVITRDWEARLKGRIESLERLLAEERQKVLTAEKKLALSSAEALSPSVSDDVKLRLREKELLQQELVESQRHLRISTDQIQGLRERLVIVEEEHHRLKMDYGTLYDEIDRPVDEEMNRQGHGKTDGRSKKVQQVSLSPDPLSSPESPDHEHPFLTKKISVVEAPRYKELATRSSVNKPDAEVQCLKAELSQYKSKCEELEFKIEEINDIWRSKSAASDREKDDFEAQARQKLKDAHLAKETFENLKQELCAKDKLITESEIKIKEIQQEVKRKNESIKAIESEIKNHEQNRQLFLTQVSQRDGSIRGLNETIRVRDERLREKDEILFKLNSSIDQMKGQIKAVEQQRSELTNQIEEKESIISSLRSQNTTTQSSRNEEAIITMSQTDSKKECARLNEYNNTIKEALTKSETERRKLEELVEQSRKTMDDSMILWKNEKATLQRDMNVLEEKVRLYEVYNTQDEGEAIESLKMEAHAYYREKENLKLLLESVEVKAEADERKHTNQLSRLQGELTEKLRLLKNEVEKNTRLALENDRLSVQASKAYRYQQEERVIKAEHQAMKVRYETRFDQMYKEFNKMVASIETLQREKDRDQEIIQTIQKNMGLVKDRYTDELLRAEDDKATLHRQMKEIEELRSHLDGLMKIVRELQDKSTDQERLRSDLITRMSTNKSSWEIERANLNSQINQLEEQLIMAGRQQNRVKDIQVNMGITWEKERKEQKRLLAEAHTLALDLQEQLRSRDEGFAHERKELVRQMEGDRLTWTKEKREAEKRMTQFESNARKLATFQKRLLDSQDALESERQKWRTDRKDLLDQLQRSKEAHARDCKRIEDAISGLVQLRELGSILEPQGSSNSDLDEKFLLHVKQAVAQINKAAEELSGPVKEEKARIGNDNDSSEIKLLSETSPSKTSEIHDEDDIIINVPFICLKSEKQRTLGKSRAVSQQNSQANSEVQAPIPASHHPPTISAITSATTNTKPVTVRKSATSNSITNAIEKLQTSTSAKNVSTATPDKKEVTGYKSSSSTKGEKNLTKSKGTTSDSKVNKLKLELDTQTWPRKLKSEEQEMKTAPVTMRPFDFYSRRYERPPSYTSGTRSAQTSRAATPEIPDSMTTSLEFSASRKSALPDPPPNFILPHHRGSMSPHRDPSADIKRATDNMPIVRRPVSFAKSLSVDSSSNFLNSESHYRLARPSQSASTTPTQDFALTQSIPGSHLLSVDSNTLKGGASDASRNKKFSPRTARRNFFAETPPPTPEMQDILTWPERKTSTGTQRPVQLPDPMELRREAEEKYVSLSSKPDVSLSSKPDGHELPQSIKTSVSWDDRMLYHVTNDHSTSSSPPTNSDLITKTSLTAVTSSIPEDAMLPPSTNPSAIGPPTSKTLKEKRKFFKKSGSLDSTVGSSIAKMGVSAIPMAAPTGFTKYDFFAAVKGKLKPVFRPKSGNPKMKDHDGRSPSPLFIPTEVPDINFGHSGSTLLPVPVPQVNFRELEREEEEEAVSGRMSARSRDFHRDEGQHGNGKWRSKSADRVAPPSRMRQTKHMGSSHEMWKYNETDL